MRYYKYYKVLNDNMLKMFRNIVFVKPVSADDYVPQVRLKEELVTVTVEELKQTQAFVTAHNLSEYKVVVGDITLVEDFTTWFDVLLDRRLHE